jgi:hypothetical protein
MAAAMAVAAVAAEEQFFTLITLCQVQLYQLLLELAVAMIQNLMMEHHQI